MSTSLVSLRPFLLDPIASDQESGRYLCGIDVLELRATTRVLAANLAALAALDELLDAHRALVTTVVKATAFRCTPKCLQSWIASGP